MLTGSVFANVQWELDKDTALVSKSKTCACGLNFVKH